MASKHQMTGMHGVYLVAAEMTRRGLIVSLTSRNARGADLLASNASYTRAWSIQVKTNGKPASFWLLGKEYEQDVSESHVYVLVNLRGDEKPDFYVVPSEQIAERGRSVDRPHSRFHGIRRVAVEDFRESWSIFD